ncbi:PAS domain S-box protein [Bradyrhizobium sp. KB893862 SZCCT0404]|uniref:PAS domain S-box protein n=1 Tax=Bradyrhizobium sp. KB893862 SZCCT0404 TaxID=2807672 RepID=UPI001BA5FE8D|nr:PAS domain S-box protein [Bradyrhizobium sp. KB893862 SZCCT0404]MBR1172494.1 PAS domain S-box protein [Bradyrhizobium sp. KB893862 SZCCT0404]
MTSMTMAKTGLQEVDVPTPIDRSTFLSTLPATPTDRTAALAIVGVSSVLFALAVPFAGTPLLPVPAFVASYQSALAVSDIITAVLLLSQFSVLRTRALQWLAGGYLFTAAAAVVHGLTFPGLFTPTGLFGAGPQTTVWLYMIWHAGFPLCVLGYAWLKEADGGPRIRGTTTSAICTIVFGVIAAMAVFAWIVTAQHDMLPVLLKDGHYTPTMIGVVSFVWSLSFAALVSLWFRRPHSVIDIWLMVVMCAWLFDIALSAIVNVARFDLGFYAGRLYGLCAAAFVLAVLLIENVRLQAQTAGMVGALKRRSDAERDYHAERERLFTAVVESSNDAIITKSLDGTITTWNNAAERVFGYSASEAVGRSIDIIMPDDQRDEGAENLARTRNGEVIDQQEAVRLHKSGQSIDVVLSQVPLRSTDGKIIGASKVARDVTERKRAEMALNREIEERQRIFETSQDLILVTDGFGNFIQVSPSVKAILGFSPEDMVGHSAIEFIHPDDLEKTRGEMRTARRGAVKRSFEARYYHHDGHEVTLNWMGTWSEPVKRHFFIGRDLTEKQAAEAQLRQVQKMDSIGQLTGGVAHDFNNVLTVITGTIGILADAVADRPELAAITKLIDDAAERGAQLTKHLLAFARKQPLQPREIDVNALALEAAKLLHPTLGEQITILPQLTEDAWPTLVDPGQLSTAILNLALNARDAMPDGGTLVLETRNVFLDDGYAAMNPDVAAGNYVMIAVSDTGSGIPSDLIERVFDPFFTTKEVGKGTGLGLSMVFGFVKQSGGHIKIYSEEGHGTSVKIYLPRSTGVQETAYEAAQNVPIAGGDEKILIVEDDALVRQYVVTQVKSLGYAALEAANAAEALTIIDADKEIDLLFTDVIMPGAMNGRQLADEAARRRPDLKTLFTSGYTENAIVHHGRLDSGVLLLAKPYRKSELARMLRTALAS